MSNDMKSWALAYGRMRWRVFPLHTIVDGACSCGKADCTSPGKHPRTKAGFKDASDDAADIERWWRSWPDSNIGLATGSGLVVIDVDGPTGAQELKALVEANERLPPTLAAETGRGLHLIFKSDADSPEVRSSARGNVHVRGEGGYIVATPSQHVIGKKYKWLNTLPVSPLPNWLRQWTQGYEINRKQPLNAFNLGPLPAHLLNRNQIDISSTVSEALRSVWTPSEEARITSALSAIPANSHDSWVAVGMSLKDLDWQRSDGTEIGFDLWVRWSETCPDKFSLGVCEARWNSFRRTGRTIGTVYHLAQQHGWNGGAPSPFAPSGQNENNAPSTEHPSQPEQLNGHAGPVQALPAAFLSPPSGAIFFPDRTEEGHPKATYTNAIVAVEALGIACEHDLFHNRMLVAGEPLAQWNNIELTDNIVMVIRSLIRHRYGFDPNKQNTSDACQFLCLKNQFDPVLDYLDELQWDGTPRLDAWLVRYMGAADTEFNRAVGRLSLIAAVRRARHPGTKFDQIVVLEGPEEGKGKSSAVRILAGPENFSDQKILGVDDRMQQELLEGVWLYEISELSGMNKAEVEHVKAFASRDEDRARPAYGRFRVNVKRRTIFFASTNRSDYLISDTGNRRFWPVLTGHIDLVGLQRDRDQLWAEAAVREAKGESHLLPEKLWKAAGEQQTNRMATDVWSEAIINYLNLKNVTDVSIIDVLCDNQFLQLRPSELGQREQNRAASILRGLDFLRYQKRLPDGKRVWRYRKSDVRQTGLQE